MTAASKELLVAEIHTLPLTLRLVMSLYYEDSPIHGSLNRDEIAAVMRWPRADVDVALEQACALLRPALRVHMDGLVGKPS